MASTPPEVAGPIGSLALSQVKPHSSTASLRAVKWHDDLRRLGLELPFTVVHDFGMVLAAGAHQIELGPRVTWEGAEDHLQRATLRYRDVLEEAHQSEAARRAPQLKMTDDVITVVLARVLGDIARRLERRPSYRAQLPLDGSLFERLTPETLIRLYRQLDRRFEQECLGAIAAARLLILTLTDSLDLDTLRLFGMAGLSEGGALAQVELLNSLETPEANDVVNFSLELLPSVLETKAKPAASTVAAFGYAGLGRRGSIDNLVLTELAWDDEELSRRMLDHEVLYYAREQQHEEEGHEHLLLIDASASMRGDRATFARAMALATGKKLLLEGATVTVRFFDARLYEPHAAQGEALPTAHLLSFKGERGRNPGRVFRELIGILDASRRGGDPPTLHVFTHAALYIPREIVQELTQTVQMASVFMLPSGGDLNLDYLDLLHAYWVVDHSTLSGGKERAEAALSILDDVEPGSSASPARVTLSGARASR
ncbi:MAG: hypothetical protein AAGN82_26025 [Myxococcota bacterium]